MLLFQDVINAGKIYESYDRLFIMNILVFSISMCQLYLSSTWPSLDTSPHYFCLVLVNIRGGFALLTGTGPV